MATPALKVTDDPTVAASLAADGTPVVLVGADAAGLGAILAAAPDRDGREHLLAVMVGDPGDPAVAAAAAEMAAELGGQGAGR
jgi:hypothetical protein